MKQLYSPLESPTFLQLPDLYKSLGIQETRFQSARQFNKAIAKTAPDIMLADKAERPYVPKLEALFHIDTIHTLPATASDIKTTVNKLYT